ncbi:tyrosine-protein kinase RYK-like [Branchiostoma lanceolatum]|uniref:tyrosine-protein kinase RYK-like n=1 Tax=Branchiostoma lanceolatum TaxID=7740 RepID=UPI0034548D0B
MAFFGAFLRILSVLGMFYPLAEGSVNLYLSGDEVKKLLGLTADLYYVKNNQVNSYALKFNLPVPADINSLHFTWRSSMPGVRYSMNLLSENTRILKKPETNISLAGEVPLAESVFRVNLTCSGQSNAEVGVNIQLNVTLHSAQNYTVLNFRRRKVCMINSDPVSKPGGGSVNNTHVVNCNDDSGLRAELDLLKDVVRQLLQAGSNFSSTGCDQTSRNTRPRRPRWGCWSSGPSRGNGS